ncbi:C-type lectin 37Db-like [Anopheles bellator]|uniref:C-type lectin 37Db-like n=1 Tax=Anopheles bellator TaxID=139047 RepID=UPI0026491313|nr:C-type lectin 37Db-like [Anopheles bellator]
MTNPTNLTAFVLFCGFVLVLQIYPSAPADDDETFALYREKSYYFGSTFKLNWFKAVEFCRSRGMFLLSVRNAAEREAVIEYLKGTGFTQKHKGLMAWISANDLGEEGEFRWASTGESVAYENWSETEPNNFEIDDCTTENCAILEYWADGGSNFNYTFNDRACRREYYFICESLAN